MNKIRAGGIVAASTAAIMLMLPAAAHADGSKRTAVNKTALATHGVGKVWFYNGLYDRAGWDLTITDRKKDKWCAEAKIIFDIAGDPDRQYRSKRACGTGRTGGKSERFTVNKSARVLFFRSIKVQLCQVEEVSLAHETCKTVQTVKNPYW